MKQNGPTVWRRAGIAMAAAAAMALTACGGDGGNGDGGDDDEIVLGFALSQSGDMAPFDLEPGEAAMLRVNELNEAGGIGGREIRTISRDVQSNPETVGSATTELLAEDVDALILPCDLDLAAPGATAAQAAEVPAVSICAGAPQMADRSTFGDYVFTANVGSDVEAATGATWAAEQGWDTAYVLQDESIEYTQQLGSYFTPTFEELGGEVIGTGAFPGGDDVNIASQVQDIANLDESPDVIYMASWSTGGATAIRQIREGGVDLPIVGAFALDGELLLDVVGNASDIYYTAIACYSYCEGPENEELANFVADYAERTGEEPSSSYALLGYNMMSSLATAWDDVESLDGETLRDALVASGPVETPIGDVDYYSESCAKIVDMPTTIIELDGGEMNFVDQQRIESVPDIGDGNTCVE